MHLHPIKKGCNKYTWEGKEIKVNTHLQVPLAWAKFKGKKSQDFLKALKSEIKYHIFHFLISNPLMWYPSG